MTSSDLNPPSTAPPEAWGTGPPTSRRAKAIRIAIISVIPGLLAWLIAPGLIRARRQSQIKVCQENMVKLDAAIEQWALAKNKDAGHSVTWSDLLNDGYITKIPICPSVGDVHSYVITKIGETPECVSGAEGHTLRINAFEWYDKEERKKVMKQIAEFEARNAEECAPKITLIEQAIKNWARDNKTGPRARLSFKALVKGGYLTHKPQCPGLGDYKVTKVGEPATCSLHSQAKQ